MVDVANPDLPTNERTLPTDTPAVTVSLVSDLLLVGEEEVVFTLTDPLVPAEVTSLALTGEPGLVPLEHRRQVAATGQSAIAAWGTGGLKTLDLSDPPRAREVGSYPTAAAPHGIVIEGRRAYVVDDVAFASMPLECFGL